MNIVTWGKKQVTKHYKEDITISKVYVPVVFSKYTKQPMTKLEKEIYKFTIIVENFSTLLSNRIISTQKNKENEEINNINQLDPTDFYRILQ